MSFPVKLELKALSPPCFRCFPVDISVSQSMILQFPRCIFNVRLGRYWGVFYFMKWTLSGAAASVLLVTFAINTSCKASTLIGPETFGRSRYLIGVTEQCGKLSGTGRMFQSYVKVLIHGVFKKDPISQEQRRFSLT